MARTANTSKVKEKSPVTDQPDVEPQKVEAPKKVVESEIPANVERLMRLYPQYERFYVTSKGFVHPEGAPEFLIKDAVLYTNKYYNQ